jgi:hypothetical protein
VLTPEPYLGKVVAINHGRYHYTVVSLEPATKQDIETLQKY